MQGGLTFKQVKYSKYTPEERAKNGTENLLAKAARHFSQLSDSKMP